MNELKNIVEQSMEIIREAGQNIKNRAGKIHQTQIQHKSPHDYVTETDKETELFLVKELGKILPGSSFLTEEKTAAYQQSDYVWIIDPIDGTTNFIHGLFPVSVSVALQHQQKTVLGIVYEVGAGEMFHAIAGENAFLNREKIRVSYEQKMDNVLIATGFPYKDYDRLDAYMQSFRHLMFHTAGIRRLGSAAADLVYVACGRMDGFYEYGLNPWDVAAGAFIVQQAGGRISDFAGGNNWLFGKEILATNGPIHEEFLQHLKIFLK